MGEKSIAKFEVKFLQVLNETGKVDEKLMKGISSSLIKQMYENMILARAFDERALKLQRQGRIGTYASVHGQEACQIGSALAVSKDDLIFPAFRENSVFLVRGMPPERLFQYWGGDERGLDIPKDVNVFTPAITVGGHLPHAVGAGMAFKYLKQKRVSLVYFSDGATSEGDFHEAMNFAGTQNAPVVFLCQNNQWAISVPVKEQTASETLAQKAIAYGFEGIQVDGNDVFAVYKATTDALNKARAGKGPTFIELLTYRVGNHTTSDDASKYRGEKIVKEWIKKDPVLRLSNYMKKKKMLNSAYEKKVISNAERIVNEAVDKYEKIKPQNPEDMFKYVYAEMPNYLKEQLEMMKRDISERDNNIKDGKE